tara:strand:+ start:420 stop:725 length:306 start_codon:yes stop_codon:yes gene_type:complete
MEEMKANPFQELSELFINNQNSMNREVHNLRSSLRNAKEKFERLIEELERDPFSAELNLLLGIDVFSMKLLEEGKSLEETRDKILNSVSILKKANEKKLGK